jgi:MFS family permease
MSDSPPTDSDVTPPSDAPSKGGSTFYWHYAWVIVAIAAIMQMVGASIRMAFGVFIEPLSQTFQWDQGDITLAYGINSVVSAIASPAAGWVGDRVGVRKAMAFGALMFIAGMAITGVIQELWQFYIAFGIILGTAQAIFLVPLLPGVMRWYRRQLGWAMGILMASWGIGPAIAAPIMGLMIVHLGWQGTFWVTAAGSAIIMAILIYLYKDSPADIGVEPYGALPGESFKIEIVIDKVKASTFASHMKKTSAYYNMSSIHFLGCVGHAVILVYLIPIAVQEGIDLVAAATILAVMAAISVPSRFAVPLLAEKVGVRAIMAIFYFLQGITVILLFWTHEHWMFYLFAVVFGIGYGGESGGFPILNRKYYGHAPQGSPYGFQMLGAGLGMALGGWIGGEIFDITNGYGWALVISIVASIAGMVSIMLLEPTDELIIPDWELDPSPSIGH